jgi:succinate dehydrogenase/fumarate reductase flavoprotein subunit
MNKIFKNNIILKIRREFTEKEKYNILMEDYFGMIRKVSHMQELQDKYEALKEQHKTLQGRYTKLRNQTK